MDQTVNHVSGHLLIIEDVYPLAEFEVCGYDHTPLPITGRNDLEQKLGSG